MKKTNLLATIWVILLAGGLASLYLIYASLAGGPMFLPLGRRVTPTFSFHVYGRSAYGAGALSRPLGAAVSEDRLFVADTGRERIQVFDKSGDFLMSFAAKAPEQAPGRAGGQPSSVSFFPGRPLSISVSPDGRVFVAVSGNPRLLVFDAQGRFESLFPPLKQPGLRSPLATVATRDKVYVTDAANQCMIVFSREGIELLKFGSSGEKPGRFYFATGLAVDSVGSMYVADSNNGRVQAFDSVGQALFETPREWLTLPRGVALDRLGRIHVVDAFNHRVAVLSRDGTPLFNYGQRGTGEGELNFPAGIAIDNSQIYIADKENDRISVWEY